MDIKFTYDKIKDQLCWQRYNNFLKKNLTVWGTIKKINPIIKINKADFEMQVDDILSKYEEIFALKVNIKGYIVTTPFSMINDDGTFSSEGVIFYSIYTANPSVVLAHELFHIFFEKYTKRDIPNYDEAKEYFTIIINDIFHNDVSKGYPHHQEVRKKIFEIWLNSKSISKCIEYLKLNY